MSLVTGILVVLEAVDKHYLETINDWFENRSNPYRQGHGWGRPFRDLSNKAGGGKHPEFIFAAAGFNYLGDDENAFQTFLGTIPWEAPECMMVLISPQEKPFRVWRPRLGFTVEEEALPLGIEPIRFAPADTQVIVYVGGMTFRASLIAGQWQASKDGEHPASWQNGYCPDADTSFDVQPWGWRRAEGSHVG